MAVDDQTVAVTTFIVRLWCETDSEGSDHWLGRVEHVGSQEVGYFRDGADLIRFLERWTGSMGFDRGLTRVEFEVAAEPRCQVTERSRE
ncbi:MAG: hypothetical protein ACUVXG_03085 [Anaerolineae bacterium]